MTSPAPYLFKYNQPDVTYPTSNFEFCEINETIQVNKLIVNNIGIKNLLSITEPVTITSPLTSMYTAQQILSGFITREPLGASLTDTLPTSASIVSLINNPIVNTYFTILYHNKSTSYNVTINGNTGITVQTDSTVYKNKSIYILFLLTNVTPGFEQISVYFLKNNKPITLPTPTLDKSVVLWNGTTGNALKDSVVTISSTGVMSNVLDPVLDQDVATKKYVDDSIAGLYWKDAVRCVTTANVGLSGPELIANTDGVTLNYGDRVLVIQQTLAVENGVYLYNNTGPWVRSPDLLVGTAAANFVYGVKEGTLYADTGFICSTDPPNDIVGTNDLVFTLYSQIIKAGSGLSKTNNILDVNVDPINMKIDTITKSIVCTMFPVGTFIKNISNVLPGYLLCDGTSYLVSSYPELYQVLNTVISTCTISISSPAVVTAVNHSLLTGQTVYFTTTGALPTGLSVHTTYYVFVVDSSQIRLAASYSELINGLLLNTTGSQTGVHTLNRTIGGVTSSTTFKVPDMRNNIMADVNSTYGVGGFTGSETKTLTTSNIPNHSHTYYTTNHYHTYQDYVNTLQGEYINYNPDNKIVGGTIQTSVVVDFFSNVIDNGGFSTTNPNTLPSATTDTAGSSTPINLLQPTFYMYFHIKY